MIYKIFNNLLNNFNFKHIVKLSEIFPEKAGKYDINIAESIKYNEPDYLTFFDIIIKNKCIILIDADRTALYQITFYNKDILQFFYLSIKNFLTTTKKKKFNNLLSIIEIPKYVDNIEKNVKQIQRLMKELKKWHSDKLKNELSDFSITEFDLEKMKTDQIFTELSLNKQIYDLYGFNRNEVSIIEEKMREFTL